MTDKQIIELNNKILSMSVDLTSKLQILANVVSERLGYDVIADLCNGYEIEFRRIMGDGVPDDDSCILLEEILAQKGE